MDSVLLSDEIIADTITKFLADTSWEEFAGTWEISFRIKEILINTGKKKNKV